MNRYPATAIADRGATGCGYWTAVMAGQAVTGLKAEADYDRAFASEREVQAEWLAARFGQLV